MQPIAGTGIEAAIAFSPHREAGNEPCKRVNLTRHRCANPV